MIAPHVSNQRFLLQISRDDEEFKAIRILDTAGEHLAATFVFEDREDITWLIVELQRLRDTPTPGEQRPF